MDKGLFDSIVQRSEELKAWERSNVFLEADSGSQIDLMDYITDGKAEQYGWTLLKDNETWRDPSNGKNRAELVKYINRACMQAGFAITVKAWKDLESAWELMSQNRRIMRKGLYLSLVGLQVTIRRSRRVEHSCLPNKGGSLIGFLALLFLIYFLWISLATVMILTMTTMTTVMILTMTTMATMMKTIVMVLNIVLTKITDTTV
jgi:hypothetical protein